MNVYVKSRNRLEDYEWLPARPERLKEYDAAPGEAARVIKTAADTFSVVLPDIPTPRIDNFRRRIDDRLVVEGVDKTQAQRLLDLYRQDIHSLASAVEAHLADKEDGTQTLTPGLEQDVERLLTQDTPPAPEQEPVQTAKPRPSFPWKGTLKLALLAASAGLLFYVRAGR